MIVSECPDRKLFFSLLSKNIFSISRTSKFDQNVEVSIMIVIIMMKSKYNDTGNQQTTSDKNCIGVPP